VIKGHIDNADGTLRAGQFISSRIELPPPQDVVELPTSAVVDDGQQCIVFVQTDAAKQQYTMRRVELTNRFEKKVFVRSRPFAKGDESTQDERETGLLPKEPLVSGERVLESGVGELKAVLLEKEAEPQKKPAESH
jgi:membrane fusion protein, heavy metal efflux system